MKNSRKGLWLKTLDEIDRAADLLAVFLLIKDGRIAGRITARATKRAMNVALIIYSRDAREMPIHGCIRMTGWGYDRTNSGIAEILANNKQTLADRFNVNLSSVGDWDIMNTWRRDFENAGFTVLQAI